jgi:pyruvate,water dikinase
MEAWGVLIIILVCPILGALPLIAWMTQVLTGQRLTTLGTGNISVSAAFYHGGRWVGILAVLSEAFKGIAAVGLARLFFPAHSAWEIIALIALVMGRYWGGRGAGTTNVVWGYIVHDWVGAGLIFLISGISFTVLRERKFGRLWVLVLMPLITALLHPQERARWGAVLVLSLLLAWIYEKIPDDLDLPTDAAQGGSREMFRFFRGDRALLTLDQPLQAEQVGPKAATLAELKQRGYPVPMGWGLAPGDDPAPLLQALKPTAEDPLVVRSSAIGEDGLDASAAGLYESILNVTSLAALEGAMIQCQLSYNRPAAIAYRQTKGVAEGGMAVLVQQQVQSVFSGVAFSRDPIVRQGDAVIIEALPGYANRVVSGRTTPEQYRVWLRSDALSSSSDSGSAWQLPDSITLDMEGEGDVPQRLIQQVAYLARHLEAYYHGIPQDIEWSYDGQQLWLLQCRPITTLIPIWTRKIAAEVIPGTIRPLTWSINQPLTCGVWGEIFTVVLGDRARGLDFNKTATLHHSAAYFNASLLGQIFRRMGLPPESLEFLTRGARFSKPPFSSTLRNLPGLLRLLQRELSLEREFNRDDQQQFAPTLTQLTHQPPTDLTPVELLRRIDSILEQLQRVTYYSILAPLSLAFRQALLNVETTQLDSSQTPEIASLRSLHQIALNARPLLQSCPGLAQASPATLLAAFTEDTAGQQTLAQLEQFLREYGYLSEVGTDIAVSTWREDPQPVYEQFVQFLVNSTAPSPTQSQPKGGQSAKVRFVQQRLNLKGRVSSLYSRLLAELRWSFVALEALWLRAGWLTQAGDLFFLTFAEIQTIVADGEQRSPDQPTHLTALIAARRSQFERDRAMIPVPPLVYGNEPPLRVSLTRPNSSSRILQGLGASPGQAEGRVRVLCTLSTAATIDQDTILVVPYTDSGWAPLLARAGGLIAEVGGRLSHGAIVAREYGIPAVMDISDATQQLQDGQQVRIDGERGIVELL